MSTSKSIIVKFRTNRPQYFVNIAQHVNFINHILDDYTDQLFYLETVDDGILHIFKNFEAFKSVHLPLKPQIINKIKQMPPEQNYLLKGIYPPDEKSKSGMILTLECNMECSDDIFPIIKGFYESLHPQIQLSINNNIISIDMPVFEAFVMYANLIYTNIELNK